jgi:Flp pilus assembly pilin Flp
MEEKEIKEQEIVEQEDKQTKKEEIKEEKKEEIKDEKSDLMVIVEAITKGFETLGKKIDTGFEALGKKIDNLGTKIDTGFEALGNKIDNLGTKIDKGFGELKDVLKKYMSRENEWTSLKLYSDEMKEIIGKELNLTDYRFHYESKENGADFLIKVMEIIKEKNETKEETKAYIIVEVKDFPSENIIIKACEQIEKSIKNYIPPEHREEKKEKGKNIITFKVPVIATILFRFWEEDPSELVKIANKALEKKKMNIKFYDFHIGYYYNNDKYQIISLYKKQQQEEQGDVEGA